MKSNHLVIAARGRAEHFLSGLPACENDAHLLRNLADEIERLTLDCDPETHREEYELAFIGHGRGFNVEHDVENPQSGRFVERLMTPAELAAREPAMKIADKIHKLAVYAAFAYVNCWEIIAPAIEAAVSAERLRLEQIHDRRVTELLAANNAELERRRAAEDALRIGKHRDAITSSITSDTMKREQANVC